MSRYIDADRLIAEIDAYCGYQRYLVSENIRNIIYSQPTADVVEVPVRCGDCKYWDSHFKECDRNCRVASSPAAYAMNFEYDDFCSYGERKTE